MWEDVGCSFPVAASPSWSSFLQLGSQQLGRCHVDFGRRPAQSHQTLARSGKATRSLTCQTKISHVTTLFMQKAAEGSALTCASHQKSKSHIYIYICEFVCIGTCIS